MLEEKFMQLALGLAEKGKRRVSPNPMAGAVLVKNGKVVGTGWHERFGGAHAEVNAIKSAGEKARGATLYVNLEPCSHYGKQPPCTKAIIEAGIKKVVCAMKDPNPLIRGKGIKELEKAGIVVECGMLRKKAGQLNEAFVKWVRTGKPFVTLKIALTQDGFISWGDGKRKKVTGRESREKVQQMRAGTDVVLVGVNTVLKDDPQLACGLKGKQNPKRVVLDSQLRMPLDAKMISVDGETTVLHCRGSKAKEEKLRENGVNVFKVKESNGMVDLERALKKLGSLEIASVLVEGGREINTSFLEKGKADKLVLFMAGKKAGKGLYFVKGRKALEKKLENVKIERIGNDLVAEAYFQG